MQKAKELPKAPEHAAPIQKMEEQQKPAEKKLGRVQLARSLSGAMPPPDGNPSLARAGAMVGAPSSGIGASGRASMATTVQRSVGNMRLTRMLNTTHTIQRKCACGGTAGEDGECAQCKAKRMALQRKARAPQTPHELPASVTTALRSGVGQPLDRVTRSKMEDSFNADFSAVRVHANAQADLAARDINANAFTSGQNIFFGAGLYQPGTQAGDKLLAHELTHTIQQGKDGGVPQTAHTISQPGEPQEQEAEQVARQVLSGDNKEYQHSENAGSVARESAHVTPRYSTQARIQRWGWLKDIGEAAWERAEWASGKAADAAEAVVETGEAAWEGAKEGAKWVGGKAAAVSEAAWERTKWAGGKVVSGVKAGWEVAKGVVNKAVAGAKWGAGKVLSAADAVWEFIKDCAGISSDKASTQMEPDRTLPPPDVSGSLPPPDRTVWERLGSQKAMLQRMWQEYRYGCWCGPGYVCVEARDQIDAACRTHDLAYLALGVSGGNPQPGEVDMWSVEGLRRTREADLSFVASLEKTKYDLQFYGPAAAAYRAGAQTIFSGRAKLSSLVRTLCPERPRIQSGASGTGSTQSGSKTTPSKETPLLTEGTAEAAKRLIATKDYPGALHIVLTELQASGLLDSSLTNSRYVEKTNAGEGATWPPEYEYDKGTGKNKPVGQCRVEYYPPAFRSVPLLVSTILREYKRVLLFQQRIPGKSRSAEVPSLDEGTWYLADHAIRMGNHSAALGIVLDALVSRSIINSSLAHWSYVARHDRGEGLTSFDWVEDPVTHERRATAPVKVDIYDPAFKDVGWLFSTIMHEYVHVLQVIAGGYKAEQFDVKGEQRPEFVAKDEVEAYLWEIEHALGSGLIHNPAQMRDVGERLRNEFETMTPELQAQYRTRYDAAQRRVLEVLSQRPGMSIDDARRIVQETSQEIAELLKQRPGNETVIDAKIAAVRARRSEALIQVALVDNPNIQFVRPGEPGTYRVPTVDGEGRVRYLHGGIQVAWHLAGASTSAYTLGEAIGAGGKMAIAGSAVQGRVHPFPPDIDFDEHIHVVAETPEEAGHNVATRIIESIRKISGGPVPGRKDLEFRYLQIYYKNGGKFIMRLGEVLRGDAVKKLGPAIAELKKGGNMNTFWRGFLADGRFTPVTRVIYVTAERRDGTTLLGLDGSAEFQFAYLEDPGALPTTQLAKFALEMCCAAVDRANRGAWLKAGKRAYNYFSTIGDLAHMTMLEPVFRQPETNVEQYATVIDALELALNTQDRGIPEARTRILTVKEARGQVEAVASKVENILPDSGTAPSPAIIAKNLRKLADEFKPRNAWDHIEQNNTLSAAFGLIAADIRKHIDAGVQDQVKPLIDDIVRPVCKNCKRR